MFNDHEIIEVERYILENVLSLLEVSIRVRTDDDCASLIIPIDHAEAVSNLIRKSMKLEPSRSFLWKSAKL